MKVVYAQSLNVAFEIEIAFDDRREKKPENMKCFVADEGDDDDDVIQVCEFIGI